MSMTLLQARVDSANDRLNQILVAQERKELARLEAEQAEQEREATERARAHAERKREYQTVYADGYLGLGLEPPLPRADELPSRFRRRLYDGLRRRLAPNHPLADLPASELAGSANTFANFERDLLQAAEQEAKQPSYANLPPPGELLQRVRVDNDTGLKTINFYGRESFVKQMSRGGHRVHRIIDPKTRTVLWGAPFSRAE